MSGTSSSRSSLSSRIRATSIPKPAGSGNRQRDNGVRVTSRNRQSTYLDALQARGGVEIIEGAYSRRPMKCPDCEHNWKRPTEKMTDVNIATHLIVGAFTDEYDTALLLSADADLIPAVAAARERGKRVVIVSPRGRRSDELIEAGDGQRHFTKSVLNRCQLPSEVDNDGRVLRRPDEWS